jgi:hypothetical protein
MRSPPRRQAAAGLALHIDPASPHHEEPPQGGVSNGDFAQDEDELHLAETIRLIPSEVEGRTMPVQPHYDRDTPSAVRRHDARMAAIQGGGVGDGD